MNLLQKIIGMRPVTNAAMECRPIPDLERQSRLSLRKWMVGRRARYHRRCRRIATDTVSDVGGVGHQNHSS